MSFLLLAACSKEEGFELVSAQADIVIDKSKTGTLVISDESNGKEIIPTSLYYEFEIKNRGKTINSFNRFQIKIEPSDELSEEIQKNAGQNIFYPSGLGSGWGFPPMPFKINQKGTASIYYHLGTYEGNSRFPNFPSGKQLESIKNIALRADLVLLSEGREMARFDLSEYK